MVVGKENARGDTCCSTRCDCENCQACYTTAIKDSESLSSATITPCTSTNTITSIQNCNKDGNKQRDTELVFWPQKSFSNKLSSLHNTTGSVHKKFHRALTTATLCRMNMAQQQQSPSSSALLRQHDSSTSSLTSDNSSSSSSKSRKIVRKLAKHLRQECDKILGSSSESLVINWRVLQCCLREIQREEGRFGVEDTSTEDAKYLDLVMFLRDLFLYTPRLCIVETKSPASVTSTIDISPFNGLKYLELKKVHPRMVEGWKMIKRGLHTLKCTRCEVGSIREVLTETLMGEAGSDRAANKKLSCMWPELKELDVSYNNMEVIDELAVEALDLCPQLETLNLTGNRINSIDDSTAFKTLSSLRFLKISYNFLKDVPTIPPNVKVLLLDHNNISSLNNNQNNNRNFEAYISKVGPYSLETFDVSSNLIADESSFRVLRDISSLKHISLLGNPISYGDKYRNSVLSYLNKLAISRHFTLDKKKLTSQEVKYALEQSKKCKYVPQFSVSSPHSHMNLMTTSAATISSLSHITSLMTQSYSGESTSSSLRSSRRKKPKIREISSIDFNESNENVSPGGGDDNESIVRVPLERAGSSLSMHERRSILADSGLEETCATIKALRDKYGADNWLLHQHPGRSEVSKIICIPENKPFMEYNPSKSLPNHPERHITGRRNSCSRCEGFSTTGSNCNDSNEKTSSDGISVVTSHNNSSVDGSDMGSYGDVYGKHFRSKLYSTDDVHSHHQSAGSNNEASATDNNHSNFVTSPVSGKDEAAAQTQNSIFDINADYMDEKFPEQSENCEHFRIFMHGQYHNLICYNGFLFEVDPHDSTIYNKWDLNSLISLEEEKCDSETETVEFRLKFNTMRKQMREKSFIMCAKEFSKFDKLVSPYIEKKMMEEFIEALQCTRCQAQFSKAMASKTVKHEKGQAPREVLVCPDPSCANEFLVTLDAIPLPNNECLEVDRGSLENSIPVPLRTSTPSVEKTVSRSVPKDRSPPVFEAIKNFASSLTTRKGVVGNPAAPHPPVQPNNSLDDKSDCVSDAKTATTSSSETVMNTRSDSDIEVLSYESSSIEVLNKCGDSESDEVDVPEAEEVPVPEFQASKSASKGPMSESTSSGSCTESIVTQYERKLQLQPISQPFSTPTVSPSLSSTSSACASLNSFTSNSTLTGSSLNSPHKTASFSTIPIRYDFVDFGKVDHRLQLWSELSVFKSAEERLLAVVKCLIITGDSNVLGLVIFSSMKIYLYKISGSEGDKPQEWLTKMNSYDISKFSRLDVLIGRHGVGVDLSGKYFAMIFRDSERASSFLEFFMCEICGELETPPMVRDLSQTQKALMCPTSPLAYFGIVRFAFCDIEHSYPVSAIVLTQEDIILVTDLSWMAAKTNEKVLAKHCKAVSTLRQIESLESDPTLVRLIYDTTKWELLFETDREKDTFMSIVKSDLQINVPTITVCSPIEP